MRPPPIAQNAQSSDGTKHGGAQPRTRSPVGSTIGRYVASVILIIRRCAASYAPLSHVNHRFFIVAQNDMSVILSSIGEYRPFSGTPQRSRFVNPKPGLFALLPAYVSSIKSQS